MNARCILLCVFLAALLPMAVASGEKRNDVPEVTVARPIVREVTDYHETSGRIEPSARAEIRPRVIGELTAVRFKAGDRVKQGDVLFEIDPRPHQARLDQAQSKVELAKASLQLARAMLTRNLAAAKAAPGSVSPQQLDQDQAAANEAAARVKVAEAGATLARLELDYCKIRAPFTGPIGRTMVDPGNIVRPEQTLAVLVRDEQMYADFSVNEVTFLNLMRAQPDKKAKVPVEVALQGEKGFPHRGIVNSLNGFVDPAGGLPMRATLENKDRLLFPGMLVKVRIAIGAPYKAILVPEGAVKASFNRRQVYIVDAQNKIHVREVTLGPMQPDGLRVVTNGLTAEDRVIVGRLTGLKPDMTVRPRQAEMPQPDAAPPEDGVFRSLPRRTSAARSPIGFGVTVDTRYVHTQPKAIYDNVGFPIEAQVSGLEGVRHLRSRCTSDGRYALDIAFASGVDLRRAEVRVKERVPLALPNLPAEVRNAGVQVHGASGGVLQIVTLTSTNRDHDGVFLSNYAAIHIKNELAREVGVAQVAVIGDNDIGVNIQLNMDRLDAYRLSAADVIRALQKEERPPDMRPSKFEETILRANVEGEILRLRDVAKVELRLRTAGEASADGKPAVALVVYLTADATASKVHERLAARLRTIREDLPPGMDLASDFNFAPYLGWFRKPAGADYAVIDLDFAPTLGSIEDELATCEAAVRAVPAVKHTLALSDNPFDVFGGRTCLLVQFEAAPPGKSDRAATLQGVRQKLAAVKNVRARVRDLGLPASFPRCGYPIDAALSGPDAAEVQLWADTLVERLRKSDALTDVWRPIDSQPQRLSYLDINREKAAIQGIDLNDFFTTLEVFDRSASIAPLHVFGRALPVRISAQGRRRDWRIEIEDLRVVNSDGKTVMARNFVTVRETEAPAALDFLDLRPMAQLTANPAAGVDLAAARKAFSKVAEETRRELRLPPEYRVTWLQP